MEDNKKSKNNIIPPNEPKLISGKLGAFLDNFWYHYKWHTVAVIFILIVLTVCTLQMCNKEKYDSFVLYAGEHEIKKTTDTADVSPYVTTISSLKRITDDFDENGTVSVSLRDLFLMSNEEIKAAEAEKGYEVNYTLLSENKATLRDVLLVSNYYLCFLSEDVYLENKEIDGVPLFCEVEGYIKEGSDAKKYDDCAIYLSSTEYYSLPGIKELPSDTLIVLRRVSAVSSHFDKKGNEQAFKNAEIMFEKIINYKK